MYIVIMQSRSNFFNEREYNGNKSLDLGVNNMIFYLKTESEGVVNYLGTVRF